MSRQASNATSTLRVPIVVGLIILSCMVGTGSLMFAAGSDRTFAVEPNYYAKALSWDKTHAAAVQSDALGWTANLKLAGRSVIVTLVDRDGLPVTSARVTAEVFPFLRAAARESITFMDEGAGTYRAELPGGPGGAWRIALTAHRGDDQFVSAMTVKGVDP